MVNLILLLLIFTMTILQSYTMVAVSHPMGCYLLLTFLLTIQLIIVYATWYSQLDRANIIYQRIRQKEQRIVYRNMHEISHGKETLLAVAGYFILSKTVLYCQNGYPAIQPLLLVFPGFYSYAVMNKWMCTSTNQIMLIYAIYVILVMSVEQFSISWCVVLLHPYLLKAIGSIPTTMLYIGSIHSIVRGVSLTHYIWQILPTVGVIYGFTHEFRAKYQQKVYRYGMILSLVQPLGLLCFYGSDFRQLTHYLQYNVEAFLLMGALLFIFLRIAPIGWGNEPMSNREMYFVQSFKEDMVRWQDGYTTVVMKKLSQLIALMWISAGNLLQPQSYFVMLGTIVILVMVNRVRWVRFTAILRLMILIVGRDQVSSLLFRNVDQSGSAFGNILVLLSSYGQKDRLSLETPTDHPYHLSYEAPKMANYSLFELLSLVYCTLSMSGLVMLPKKVRLMENIAMLGYPLVWFGLYAMLSSGRLDMIQIQIYGYVSAEVMLLHYR